LRIGIQSISLLGSGNVSSWGFRALNPSYFDIEIIERSALKTESIHPTLSSPSEGGREGG
jgi:hypothetical protein